ncbi:unnamed protein product [Scytosiphon promiscuus]
MLASLASIAALLALVAPSSSFVRPHAGSSLQQAAGFRNAAPASASSSCLSMSTAPRVENVAAILLAGGVGKRMEADLPKQFLELQGETVLDHSLKLFLRLKGVSQLILVLDEQYRPMLEDLQSRESRLIGCSHSLLERQESVYNALQKVDVDASLVCIHDVARPLVTKASVIADADKHGAAVLGVPMKATVKARKTPREKKESEDGQFVQRTIDRSRLWDIQTPQVVKPDILRQGFERVMKEGWMVTDDVSIVEQLNLPVKLTEGEYTNLKLTTPEDLVIAAQILETRRINESGGLDDDDDEDEEGKESISKIRANQTWTEKPFPAGDSVPEEKESISSIRANQKWVETPAGGNGSDNYDEPLVNLSKLRAGN